jgi:hypothetical protein
MMQVDELIAVMKDRHIRMAGLRHQAKIAVDSFEPGENVLDAVKASEVRVDNKRIGYGGFALLFLSQSRLLVLRGETSALDLSDIASVSELQHGSCTTSRGAVWEVVHAKGMVRVNGNKQNTDRFYASLCKAFSDAKRNE